MKFLLLLILCFPARALEINEGAAKASVDSIDCLRNDANGSRFKVGSGCSNSETVFNEDSADIDFRVEGDGDANLVFSDAGNDRVGIKTNGPTTTFDVNGNAQFGSGATKSTFSTTGALNLASDAAVTLLGSNGRIGIGTGSPATKLHLSSGSITVDGNAGANITHDANGWRVKRPADQTIGAGGTVAADACGTWKPITAAGAVTTSTTDTFAAPANANIDCCMDVVNVGTNAITLDNNARFYSAGAVDVVLGAQDSVRVCSAGAGTWWVQIGATGNN